MCAFPLTCQPLAMTNFTMITTKTFSATTEMLYQTKLMNKLGCQRFRYFYKTVFYSTTTTNIPPTEQSRENIRPSPLTDEIIRVDHAGEMGADRIYAGQMAVLGNSPMAKTIGHMWEQEKEHRRQFEDLIRKYRVRPTVMLPLWNAAGFALGAATALMGEKAAMACTVAVETVIVEHYNEQLRKIMDSPKPDEELLKTITKFRDEEQEHHDTGIDCGAEQAPFYKAMTEVIKFGCKTAIAISKKI